MLTHKQVQEMIVRYMESGDRRDEWERIGISDVVSGHGRPDYDGYIKPDLVFRAKGRVLARMDSRNRYNQFLGFEIKSEYSNWAEIQKGIGQCAEYYAYGLRPFLVAPEKHAERLLAIGKRLKFLTIVLYDPSGRIKFKS